MKLLSIPLILLLLASCRPSLQTCNDLYGECGRIDTLSRTVTLRDTTVITDVDTVTTYIPILKRDMLTLNRIIEKYRKQHVNGDKVHFYWLNDSTLKAEAICPRDTVKIHGRDRIEVRTQFKTVTKEVTEVPKWAWIVMAVLGGLLVLLFLIRR